MIQLFVLFSFFLWVPSLLGIGSFLNIFISKYFKDFEITHEIKILYYGLLGLIVVAIIGTFFNFFIPLNQIFSTVILLLGIALFYVRRKDILIFLNRIDIFSSIILLIFCGLFSLMKLTNYDTGLYHLPLINWISNSALPFGIANLHDRFGFNSLWFIDASVIYPLRFFTKSPFFIINTVLYFFYGTFVFLTLLKITREKKFSFSSFFVLTTFLPWSYLLTTFATSPSPDTPVMLITFFITFLIIKYYETKKNDYLFAASIFSFFALAIKLAAFPYFIGIIFILMFNFIFKKSDYFKYAITSLILLAMGILYLIRGIISSGYIAFPSTLGHFNFRWTVLPESATSTANWIKSWARKPGVDPSDVLGNWNWMEPWIQRNIVFLRPWIVLVLIGIIASLICFILKKKRNAKAFFIIVFLSLIGCAFWFFAAPEPRFGYGYLFSFSGILLSYALYNILTDRKINNILWKTVFIIFSFLLFFQNNLSYKEITNTKKIGDAKYIENTTLESKIILAPKKDDRCLDAPLLCTPYFNENLKIVFDKNDNPRMFFYEK